MRGHMRLYLIGQIVDVDDGLCDPCPAGLVEHMVEQGLPRHLDQRFRTIIGQWTHPRAKTRRHHHGRIDGHASKSSGDDALISCGIVRSNQSRTFTRPGWARSRSNSPHMRGRNDR